MQNHPAAALLVAVKSKPAKIVRASLALLFTISLIGTAQPARAATTARNAPATPLVLAPRVVSPAVSSSTCNTEIDGDNVTDFASIDASALRDAVGAVATGGTVKVAGICAGAISQGGSTQVALITKTLTLMGGYTVTNWLAASDPTNNATSLNANFGGRVISATQPITVANLAILFGSIAGPGAGIFTNNALVLSSTLVLQNTATSGNGGGVYAAGATTIRGGSFQFNTTSGRGGGIYAASTLTVTGALFLVNSGPQGGGGAFAAGAATLDSAQFFNNRVTLASGGGMYANNTLAMSGTLFVGNSAEIEGGGAIALGATTLNNTRFISNTAKFSGGGAFFNAPATLTGTSFTSNTTSLSGGGAYFSALAALNDSTFTGNNATNNGGGVYANGAVTLTGGLFHSNNANVIGGGVYVSSTLVHTGTLFISNTAHTGGGAYAGSAATLNGGQFQSNKANNIGGGVYAASKLVLTGTQFISNTASFNRGGGVYAASAVVLHNAQFSQNQAFVGGGVFAVGAVTLNGGLFQNNYSFGSSGIGGGAGGGGMVTLSTLALTGTHFTGNKATINGGGVTVYGAATFNGGRFEDNISERIGGGGVFALNTITLSSTTFISNTAPTGGGLYLFESPSPSRIVNSLFARNRADVGDAIYLLDGFGFGGTVEVIHTTIASPTLSGGTAIVVEAGTANLTNTIIANHSVGISQTGIAIVNEDYTLFFGNTTNKLGVFNSGPNSFTRNPAFVDAANDNYRLTVTSVANDVAANAGIATDRDGSPRPTFGGFDIGAYEFQGPNNAPTANAGPAQTVLVQSSVTLNGGSSFDPDNHAFTFAWTQISGAPVLLSSSTAASPFFTAPASGGPLVFRLIVTDQYGLPSAPSDVTITVNNNAPTAEAGPAQIVQTNEPVALDGLGSFDPDNQAITFAWVQVSGPAVTLSSNTAAEPAFTAPAVTSPATVVFQLVVTDAGGLASAPAQVIISVTPQQVMLPVVVR